MLNIVYKTLGAFTKFWLWIECVFLFVYEHGARLHNSNIHTKNGLKITYAYIYTISNQYRNDDSDTERDREKSYERKTKTNSANMKK